MILTSSIFNPLTSQKNNEWIIHYFYLGNPLKNDSP